MYGMVEKITFQLTEVFLFFSTATMGVGEIEFLIEEERV